MKIKLQTPTGNVLDCEALSVDFEALDGHFTILPKHADFVSVIATGIILIKTSDNKEIYVATNSGILSKKGSQVSISVRNAILNEDIDILTNIIETEFKKFNEERKETNTAMARLEIGITRGFMKLNKGEINV
ncbi:MAG: ATP synthase epsilon chain [Alphaproteobacteria bacterium ADurb.Bin438]|nr:MAG: ATP synthase epsilon chain [Alphaproteobacteria bacterium ADurb.Bin438]